MVENIRFCFFVTIKINKFEPLKVIFYISFTRVIITIDIHSLDSNNLKKSRIMSFYQDQPERPRIENNFRSSYNRSFEYKNVVDLPLNHVRVKRGVRQDLSTSVLQERCLSTYNESFGVKKQDSLKNCYPRFSLISKPNLRRIHEEYVGNPPKPLKFGLTTTGTTHKMLNPISTPQTLLTVQPGKEYICPIDVLGKEDFPSIPLNETSAYKLSDNYVSTTHLTHSDFSENQRSGIAKKDVITYYDSVGVPKCRGTRVSTHFGPHFQKVPKNLFRQLPKQFCRIPYSGNTSTYNKDYKCGGNLVQFEHNIEFPVLYKLTKGDILTVPGMYFTESCHLGTGLPVRSVIDIGKDRRNF